MGARDHDESRIARGGLMVTFVAGIILLKLTTVANASFASPPLLTHLKEGRYRRVHVRQNVLTMYVPSSTPTSQTPLMVAANMYQSRGAPSSSLCSSDTLPSFRAVHGLLSPQTVMRLDEVSDGSSDELQYFLDTYKEHGPMACIHMLSDPQVLPELTKAMRATM